MKKAYNTPIFTSVELGNNMVVMSKEYSEGDLLGSFTKNGWDLSKFI